MVALYQLQWTRAPAHAVVDGAVRTCARLGKASAKGLVNAVLRNFLREREALLERARATPAGRFSYPQWWIDELERAYPDRFEAILDAGNLHPPLTLRVNRRRVSVEAYLRGAGRRWPPRRADRSSGCPAAAPGTGRSAAGIRGGPGLGAGSGGATRCAAAGPARRHARAGCLRRAGWQDRSPAGNRRYSTSPRSTATRSACSGCGRTSQRLRLEARLVTAMRPTWRAGGTGSRSTGSCWTRPARPPAWCGAIPTSNGCARPRTSTRLAARAGAPAGCVMAHARAWW